MESIDILKSIKSILEDKKVQDIMIYRNDALADYFIIASLNTSKSLKAVCSVVLDYLSDIGVEKCSCEGFDHGHWIVVDAGVVVLHLFKDNVRDYYKIDEYWSDSDDFYYLEAQYM
ncbi:MAG: hypothetical protein P857_177 [Candidatus Xenolissoclinum pacificiensis L6]|uniref:Ribosomal silencing factor RsfS n=1 Tax=Candidatus Xenolissoclinum pacificiensis L6 TaxID=1401685 RepID=W2UZW0_9RICK|nr:MAG: hypothetical protein P857_177 [Candidatus Xenolissoclinum pacificiensis L6]